MNRPSGRPCFYLSVLGAFAALLFTGAGVQAQGFPYKLYQYHWFEVFNNSATNTDTHANWVANAFVARPGFTQSTCITLPIGASFSNWPIHAWIYDGVHATDRTLGLPLLSYA